MFIENMPTKAKQAKVIRELYEYDHAFLTPEGAAHFAEPFGFKPHLYVEKANPQDFKGLTLRDGLTEAEGVEASKLALQIASHLGVTVPDMYGIGSQLRIACARILEHLVSKEKVAA